MKLTCSHQVLTISQALVFKYLADKAFVDYRKAQCMCSPSLEKSISYSNPSIRPLKSLLSTWNEAHKHYSTLFQGPLVNTSEEWACLLNLYQGQKVRLFILEVASKHNQFLLSILRVKAVPEPLSSFFWEEMSSRKNYGLPMITYNLISYTYH